MILNLIMKVIMEVLEDEIENILSPPSLPYSPALLDPNDLDVEENRKGMEERDCLLFQLH